MKRIANILAALAIVAPAAAAFPTTVDSADLKLYDINVAVDEGAKKVRVKIDLDINRFNVGKDREIVFTPVLRADDGSDSLLLEPVTVAGRNRWYHYLRNGFIDENDSRIFRAGKKTHAIVADEFEFMPWMAKSTLEMDAKTANCCDKPDQLVGPSPNGDIPLARIDVARPEFIADFIFAPPVDAGPVVKKIEGSAFVTFVVNRTELKPDYMNNPEEIGKILASIKLVQDDPEAIITGVTIKGYASPEGPWDNNVRLAMGRTQTLKEYVRQRYNFDPSIMSSDYEPEDWAGLREWLVENDIPNRDAILQIVDSDLAPDPKNAEIQRRYPEQYRQIHRDVYPWLRHSDYTIKYTFKIHTDVEELKRIYAATPDRLRPVDFQRIAATYPAGSREFDEVMMTAVRIWPNDELANLNAANISMKRDDMTAAARYLAKAGTSPEAMYARGVQAARLGDISTALRLVESARQAGVPQADGAIAILKAEIERPFVTYMITPTGAGE